jgi:hypothetical protein
LLAFQGRVMAGSPKHKEICFAFLEGSGFYFPWLNFICFPFLFFSYYHLTWYFKENGNLDEF